MKPKILLIIAALLGNVCAYSQNSLTISGTGLTIQKGITLSQVGNIDITDNSNGTGILDNSGIVNINGDLNNSSSTRELGNGEIIFAGDAKQFISGINTFGDLTLDKTGGDITLDGNANVAGQLKFIKGILNTSNVNLFTLNNTATVFGSSQGNSGANNSSFVNGPMTKSGNSNFIFPIGKSISDYPLHPLEIELNDNTDVNFTAEYFASTPKKNQKLSNNLKKIANNEFWTLKRGDGLNNAYVTLYFSDIIVDKPAALVVAYLDDLNSDVWENGGSTDFNLDDPKNMFVRSKLMTTFGQFTYGSNLESQDLIRNPEYFNPVGGSKSKTVITNYEMKVYPNPNSGKNVNVEVNKVKKIK